jgi:hypothetical protein
MLGLLGSGGLCCVGLGLVNFIELMMNYFIMNVIRVIGLISQSQVPHESPF